MKKAKGMGKESLRGAYDEKFDIEKEYSERVNKSRTGTLLFMMKVAVIIYLLFIIVAVAQFISSDAGSVEAIIYLAIYEILCILIHELCRWILRRKAYKWFDIMAASLGLTA